MNTRDKWELTKWLAVIIGLATIAWMCIWQVFKAALVEPKHQEWHEQKAR